MELEELRGKLSGRWPRLKKSGDPRGIGKLPSGAQGRIKLHRRWRRFSRCFWFLNFRNLFDFRLLYHPTISSTKVAVLPGCLWGPASLTNHCQGWEMEQLKDKDPIWCVCISTSLCGCVEQAVLSAEAHKADTLQLGWKDMSMPSECNWHALSMALLTQGQGWKQCLPLRRLGLMSLMDEIFFSFSHRTEQLIC